MALFVAFIIFLVAIRLPWVWWWEKVFNFHQMQKRAIDAEEQLSKSQGVANPASFDNRRRSTKLVIYGVSAFICFIYALTCAATIFTFQYKNGEFDYLGIGAWGPVGDFFGGILNPILAFASFMALLHTIRIQSEELKLTRQEFEKSAESQKVIAETAKSDLELARNSFAIQVELQMVQTFINVAIEYTAKCEILLNNYVKINSGGDAGTVLSYIENYGDKDNPKRFHYSVCLLQSQMKLAGIGEAVDDLKVELLNLCEYFDTAWKAVLSFDSLMKAPENYNLKIKFFGLVAKNLGHTACCLHITDTKNFSHLTNVHYEMGKDPLVDDFRSYLLLAFQKLDTTKK